VRCSTARGALDNGAVPGDAPAMTEPRFSIPVDELVAGVEVPLDAQVEEQAEPRRPATDWSAGVHPYGDGMSGDADGD
jgi:hypothetical protein